jgi:hypothetical protein
MSVAAEAEGDSPTPVAPQERESATMSSDRQQRLIDALQVIGPLAERVDVTSKQQQQDAASLLDATRRAIEIVRETQPGKRAEKGGAS